nr:hypothetical protein [Burkholderia ambifaria]
MTTSTGRRPGAGAHARSRACDLALPGLGVADISGRDHVIERSPALVRQLPKESLFACQILSGRPYFIQRDRCLLAEAGDVVVYDTRVPYLFGFLTPMRQLLVDIPITTFDDRFDAQLAALPLRIAPKPGAGASWRRGASVFVLPVAGCPTRCAASPTDSGRIADPQSAEPLNREPSRPPALTPRWPRRSCGCLRHRASRGSLRRAARAATATSRLRSAR